VRALFAFVVLGLALVAATAPAGGATSECHGIQQCIHVPGPWVVVPAHGSAQYLLACPQGRSVVGGLDAQVTSRKVHVEFEGRLGAPVQPGITTTRYALFRAVSTAGKVQEFQPVLGCIPTQGGGGRSTVSARVTPPGPAPEFRSRIVVVGPAQVRVARVACLANESLAGSWEAVAFRTRKPPLAVRAALVHARLVVTGKHVAVTASATDALSVDDHAIVQAGAECVQ